MDAGISREQMDAVKGVFRRWTQDPVSLRCLVSVVILAVGYFTFVRPLTIRLEEARGAHTRRSRRLAKVEDLAHWKSQTDKFVDRTAHSEDVVEWQRYVLEKLGLTKEVRLLNLEPRPTTGKGVYKFIEMEIVARSRSYSDFATFIHHLERGERVVRIDRIRIELAQGSLTLTATIKGLCRPSLAPSDPMAETETEGGDVADGVVAEEGAETTGEGGEAAVADAAGEAPVEAALGVEAADDDGVEEGDE